MDSKEIVIASLNPVKINTVRMGFEKVFPGQEMTFRGVTVKSGVSDQPLTDEVTLLGAVNRATAASITVPEGDFWVGIEGGVAMIDERMTSFAWIVIKSLTQTGMARTGTFFLPPKVAELIKQGKELGEADDIVFGLTNSKQQNGAVGILTKDLLNRTSYYEPAVILALIPFINPDLFPI